MKLLGFLAEAFIAAFGISEPAPGKERLVHLVLGSFILAVFVLVLGLGLFLLIQIHSGR